MILVNASRNLCFLYIIYMLIQYVLLLLIILCDFRYDEEHIYELHRSGHTTCNVWGYMSVHGVGDLERNIGLFTQDRYLQFLSEDLLASLENWDFPFPPGPIYFLQVYHRYYHRKVVSAT